MQNQNRSCSWLGWPTVTFLLFLIASCNKNNEKHPVITLDEKKYALHESPTQIILFNDSLVLIQNNSSIIYLSSFNSGKIFLAIDLFKIKSVKNIIRSKLNEINLQKVESTNKLLNNDKISIRSITKYDSCNYIVAWDYNFFHAEINRQDTVYVNTNESFFSMLYISKKEIKINVIYDYKKMEKHKNVPMFGFFINKDTMYVANLVRNRDSIPIFSCYNKRNLTIYNNSTPIYHQPYFDKKSSKYISTFYMGNFFNVNMVSNEYLVQNMNSGKCIVDFRKYIPNIKSIFFFSPTKGLKEWYLYYSTTEFDKKQRHKQYWAKINTQNGKANIENTTNAVYASKGDTIIRLKKKGDNFVYEKIF